MDNQTIDKLSQLKAIYVESLPAKLNNYELQWAALKKEFSPQQFTNFYRNIHSLCGSSGTYGFLELSTVTRDLEHYLKSLLDKPQLDASEVAQIDRLFAILRTFMLELISKKILNVRPKASDLWP